MEVDLQQQAKEMLTRMGILIKFKKANPQQPPPWIDSPFGEHGYQYMVTLYSKGRVPIQFDYWGSIADKQEDKEVKLTDILSCIALDALEADLIPEKLADAIQISIEQARRVVHCARKLKWFFEDEELEIINDFIEENGL